MATPISNELNKQINILFAGRSPVFTLQGIANGATAQPSSAGDGVDASQNDGAVKAIFGLKLRQNAGRFTAWLKIVEASGAQTYGLDVLRSGAGNYAVFITGQSTVDTIIAALLAAFEASSPFGVDGGSAQRLGTSNVIEITWEDQPDSVVIGNTTAGTTYQSLVSEADRARLQLWGYFGERVGWGRLGEPIIEEATSGDRLHRVDVSGASRLACEVLEADGVVLSLIAPALLDGQTATFAQTAAAAWDAYVAAASWVPSGQNGDRPAFTGGWGDGAVACSSTSALLSSGGAYVEIQNLTGADLFLAFGGAAATTSDYKLPDGEAWYSPPGEPCGPVQGILASGTGNAYVVTRR